MYMGDCLSAHKGQNLAMDFPELELQIVVKLKVDAGNQSCIICKRQQVLLTAAVSSAPTVILKEPMSCNIYINN